MRRQKSSKFDTCTEGVAVYAASISGKVARLSPGRSDGLLFGGYPCREGPGRVVRSQQGTVRENRLEPESKLS